jgi:hypothetical protein
MQMDIENHFLTQSNWNFNLTCSPSSIPQRRKRFQWMVGILMLQSSPTLPILFPFSPPLFYKNRSKSHVASEELTTSNHVDRMPTYMEGNWEPYGGRRVVGRRKYGTGWWAGLLFVASLYSSGKMAKRCTSTPICLNNMVPNYCRKFFSVSGWVTRWRCERRVTRRKKEIWKSSGCKRKIKEI